MTVPADYSAVTLTMTPSEISQTSLALQFAVEEVASSLEVINTTVTALALGWAGTTATQAKDFVDQWLAAMTSLFGSQDGATQGVLDEVVTILATCRGRLFRRRASCGLDVQRPVERAGPRIRRVCQQRRPSRRALR